MKCQQDHKAATQEAFEEAAVKGKVHRIPIGAFIYWKRIDGNLQRIRVHDLPVRGRNEAQ